MIHLSIFPLIQPAPTRIPCGTGDCSSDCKCWFPSRPEPAEISFLAGCSGGQGTGTNRKNTRQKNFMKRRAALRIRRNRSSAARRAGQDSSLQKSRSGETYALRGAFQRGKTECFPAEKEIRIVNRRIIRIHAEFRVFIPSDPSSRHSGRRRETGILRKKTEKQSCKKSAQTEKRFNSFHGHNLRGLDFCNIAQRRIFSRMLPPHRFSAKIRPGAGGVEHRSAV